jgi:hypothetical protein
MSETELTGRLEKLERDNRRLKGFAVAALVLATALATIYATQPVPQKVTAHTFEVVDDSGRLRAELRMSGDRPALTLYDAQRFPVVALAGGDKPALFLIRAENVGHVLLSDSFLRLVDAQGFEIDLGSTGKLNGGTGATEQTSAASIVMFGNDEKHHVIWQAP